MLGGIEILRVRANIEHFEHFQHVGNQINILT